jgi:hypothetical protein
MPLPRPLSPLCPAHGRKSDSRCSAAGRSPAARNQGICSSRRISSGLHGSSIQAIVSGEEGRHRCSWGQGATARQEEGCGGTTRGGVRRPARGGWGCRQAGHLAAACRERGWRAHREWTLHDQPMSSDREQGNGRWRTCCRWSQGAISSEGVHQLLPLPPARGVARSAHQAPRAGGTDVGRARSHWRGESWPPAWDPSRHGHGEREAAPTLAGRNAGRVEPPRELRRWRILDVVVDARACGDNSGGEKEERRKG